jgi:hypothetical protein
LQEIWHALRGDPAHLARLAVTAKGALPSVFCVTDLATATIGAASLARGSARALLGGFISAVRACAQCLQPS